MTNTTSCKYISLVAPYTGAWIEITTFSFSLNSPNVAPYTGAWIEIINVLCNAVASFSRSLHGSVNWNINSANLLFQQVSRSLHGSVNWNIFTPWPAFPTVIVAPYTGAWIEIHITSNGEEIFSSLPTRERELKLNPVGNTFYSRLSLPTRERELK